MPGLGGRNVSRDQGHQGQARGDVDDKTGRQGKAGLGRFGYAGVAAAWMRAVVERIFSAAVVGRALLFSLNRGVEQFCWRGQATSKQRSDAVLEGSSTCFCGRVGRESGADF